MRYLVMECHMGYAVVLDEQGAFHKVVNKCYEVGQSVEDVICFAQSVDVAEKKIINMPVLRVVATAACVGVAMLGVMQNYVVTYGKVHVQINPDIMLSVNKQQYVVGMETLNEDGEVLVEGYSYRMKKVDVVLDELAEKASEQGYLKSDGEIYVELISDSEEWNTTTKALVEETLDATLEEDVTLTVEAVIGTEASEEEVTDDATTSDVEDDATASDAEDDATTPDTDDVDASDTNSNTEVKQRQSDTESQIKPKPSEGEPQMPPEKPGAEQPGKPGDESEMHEFEERNDGSKPNQREGNGGEMGQESSQGNTRQNSDTQSNSTPKNKTQNSQTQNNNTQNNSTQNNNTQNKQMQNSNSNSSVSRGQNNGGASNKKR